IRSRTPITFEPIRSNSPNSNEFPRVDTRVSFHRQNAILTIRRHGRGLAFLSHPVVSRVVSTLVVCLDRGAVVERVAGVPVVGEQAVRELVTEAGLVDPEDSRTNCFLEGLRVSHDLEADGE